MPCIDNEAWELSAIRIRQEDGERCQEEVDRLTRYLCGVIYEIRRMVIGPGDDLPHPFGVLYGVEANTDGIEVGELQEWWRMHLHEEDRRRQLAERSRQISNYYRSL